MFLIAITKKPIQVKLDNTKYKIKHIIVNQLSATIATDNFLSQYFTDTNGFSIIESPLVNRPNVRDIILSEIIFDKEENKLSISANTYSGRPIYYHLNTNGEFYCSTHISMLKAAGISLEENTSVLPEFFTYQFVIPPKTLFKNINRLSFGAKLYIGITGDRCTIESEKRYDPFSIKSMNYKKSDPIEKIVNQTYADILHSVNRLGPLSDRLAVLLSGGLDSSILFNICKNIFGINESYSTSYPFEDQTDDKEKYYALSAAEAFGSDHYFYKSDNNEFLFGFLEAISIVEEPIIWPQEVLFYLLYKNGITGNKDIMVCGQGAETAFGNSELNHIYRLSKHRELYKLLSLYPLFSLVKAASKITKRGHGFVKRIKKVNNIYKPLEDPDNIIYSIYRRNKDWVCKYLNVSIKDINASRYELLKLLNNNSICDKLSVLYINDELISTSNWSKICEFNSKIIYYPFLDLKLLNNAFSINWAVKLKHPKNVLQGVARDLYIPEFIIKRKKIGIAVQNKQWITVLNPLIALASKCFDKNIITDFQSKGSHPHWMFWIILNYAIWKRLFIDNESLDTLREELSKALR